MIGGYPLGLPYIVFQQGTVASIAMISGVPKILLSAVANHGNSGGPVFNDRGKVVGILEGEIPGQEHERTGIELVVPAFYVEKLMKGGRNKGSPICQKLGNWFPLLSFGAYNPLTSSLRSNVGHTPTTLGRGETPTDRRPLHDHLHVDGD